MQMTSVKIDIPAGLAQYTVELSDEMQLLRNAMIVYPYIQDGTISHGKAAEVLGVRKLDLISLYSKVGLPYFDMTEKEFEEDLATIRNLKKVC